MQLERRNLKLINLKKKHLLYAFFKKDQDELIIVDLYISFSISEI